MERYWVPSTAKSAVFGTDIVDYWFPVSQGGDIAFLYGVCKIILENGWEDEDFIQNYAAEFESFKAAAQEIDWATLERDSGLIAQSMQEFAELIRDAKNAVLVWSMGITQHAYGGDAVALILNLGLAQRLRRPRQMRTDADPRSLLRARRRGDGRLRDRVSRRQTDQRAKRASACPRNTDFEVPGLARD